MAVLAVIGTAGRGDRMDPRLTREVYDKAFAHLSTRLEKDMTLISGGAPWSDHLAVRAYLEGRVKHLILCLPAPLGEDFAYENNTYDGRQSGKLHLRFQAATGIDSFQEFGAAIEKGAQVDVYDGFMARNAHIANGATQLICYHTGLHHDGGPPPGGSRHTWYKAEAKGIPRECFDMLTLE